MKKRYLLGAVAVTFFSFSSLKADFKPFDENGNMIRTGRGAEGKVGIVSTSKYEASKIGMDVLKKGGNAIDAAVAAGFALGVAEPNSSGLGGGGFMLIRIAKTGETVFIDFRESAKKFSTKNVGTR